MNDLDIFPDDIILEIAFFEPIESINKMCLINKRFNNLICNNNYFWREKFAIDYSSPETHDENILSWKLAYQDYGKVVAFGYNSSGELGLDDNKNRLSPTPLFTDSGSVNNRKAKFVACGNGFTMIIDLNNSVWGFGSNTFGQLGLGDVQNRSISTSLLVVSIIR